jgi:MoaA/NifB/PqqE/SkfB family radical SAM enzyme
MKTLGSLQKTLNLYDPNIANIFLPWACRHPKYLRSFFRLRRSYLTSEKIRKGHLKEGVKIPPFLILSVTSKCNLKCNGCYASAAGTVTHQQTTAKPTLKLHQWMKIIKEASEIGVFGFVVAGGEPFLYPHLIDIFTTFKHRFFIVITNGTLLKKEDYKTLKKLGNIAIIVSIEGNDLLTDNRRGTGVFEKAMNTLQQLNTVGVINGVSVTITRTNYDYWTKEENIDHLIEQGIRVGIFIEHIPTTAEKQDHDLMLTNEERNMFRKQMLNYRETKSIYIVHSPGDEEFFGGCISAGRGFAHITPAGDLTPCPVSSIATHNLTTSTLLEGFASPLFKRIRESEHLLETEGMPCALFAHPKEVEELAQSVGAYKTDMNLK